VAVGRFFNGGLQPPCETKPPVVWGGTRLPDRSNCGLKRDPHLCGAVIGWPDTETTDRRAGNARPCKSVPPCGTPHLLPFHFYFLLFAGGLCSSRQTCAGQNGRATPAPANPSHPVGHRTGSRFPFRSYFPLLSCFNLHFVPFFGHKHKMWKGKKPVRKFLDNTLQTTL